MIYLEELFINLCFNQSNYSVAIFGPIGVQLALRERNQLAPFNQSQKGIQYLDQLAFSLHCEKGIWCSGWTLTVVSPPVTSGNSLTLQYYMLSHLLFLCLWSLIFYSHVTLIMYIYLCRVDLLHVSMSVYPLNLYLRIVFVYFVSHMQCPLSSSLIFVPITNNEKNKKKFRTF